MGTIQLQEANFIRAEWKKRIAKDPNLKCTHNNGFDKEYHFGTATGDYVCPQCGEVE